MGELKRRTRASRKDSRSLAEFKGNGSSVTSPHQVLIDVDDSTSLADRADVQHGLVFRLYSGCVGQDEY